MKNLKIGVIIVTNIILICNTVNAGESTNYPYALFQDVDNMTPGISKGAVSLDKVLEWRERYQEELTNYTMQESDLLYQLYDEYFQEESCAFLNVTKCDDRYEIYDEQTQQMWRQERQDNYYVVMNEDGQYVYRLSLYNGEYSTNAAAPFLCSCVNENTISLRCCTDEELDDFLKKEREYYNQQRKLSMQDVDKSENFDFVCKIWELRDVLGVEDIYYNTALELCILGTLDEEEFRSKLQQEGYEFFGNYVMGAWYMDGRYVVPPEETGKKCEEQKQYIQTMQQLDDPELFIEQQKKLHSYIEENLSNDILPERMSEEQWQQLENALKIMKEQYPNYSCRNLYYHIAGDYQIETYQAFEPELVAFVSTLEYHADNNVVVEEEFGDPEYLELKSLLRKYKEIYPEMEYQDIYETHLKATEESAELSKREKLYWYLWQKYSFENQIEETAKQEVEENKTTKEIKKEDETKENIGNGVIVCSVVLTLFAGVVVMQMIKKRKEEK